jgi:hypothetical protein
MHLGTHPKSLDTLTSIRTKVLDAILDRFLAPLVVLHSGKVLSVSTRKQSSRKALHLRIAYLPQEVGY